MVRDLTLLNYKRKVKAARVVYTALSDAGFFDEAEDALRSYNFYLNQYQDYKINSQ